MGSILPTNLHAAFMCVAPKSARIQSSCQYCVTLLGSTRAKAAHKMLIKLTHGFDNAVADEGSIDAKIALQNFPLPQIIKKMHTTL